MVDWLSFWSSADQSDARRHKAIANASAFGKVLAPEARAAIAQWHQEHQDELDDCRMSEVGDVFCTAIAALNAHVSEEEGYKPMDTTTQYLVAAQLTSSYILAEAIGRLADILSQHE